MKEILSESGIRNINQLRKDFKNAKIFYHIDLDGVTSALAMKKYLEDKGFKVIGCEGIQYGDKEYSVEKSDPAINLMNVLVDFAHGKPMFHIMTDHHDRQAGVEKDTSTSFRHSRSNVETLSQIIPTAEIFPPEDVKIVSMVDSADYARNEVTPEMVMNYIFDFDKDKGLASNKLVLGLVTNKMLLAFKNKPGFLDTLVMECKPSLMSIFQKISSIVKEKGWPGRETLEKNKEMYVASMKSNPNVQVDGTILVQYGGGNMMKPGSYDRYTPFRNNPEADFLVIAWPLGLLQASCNPFKKERELKGVNLGEIAQEVLSKWEGQLKERDVKLSTIKWISESSKDFGDMSVGFTYKDFLALYSEKYSVMENGERFLDIIYDLMEKPFSKLSDKELEVLDRITVPAWDLIQANSGGHKCITNISGLNFLGRNSRPPSGGSYRYDPEREDAPYIKFLKMLQKEFVKVLKNKIEDSKSGKTLEESIIQRVKKKVLKESKDGEKLYSEDFPTDLKELLDKVSTEIPEIKKENICRELSINGGGYVPDNGSVDSEAEKDANKLLDEFNTKFGKDGKIVSGYRSWENQIDNFKNKVSGSRSADDVQNSNSIPGFSQHHTGKCFDIYSVNLSDWTEEMKSWVEENVDKHGFKVTYKENNNGRINEPWHIAKEDVEFVPISDWEQWCGTKGDEKKEVTFQNFDFGKLEKQNLKGANLFKLLLIIFGIGKLMTPEGREFLRKIKERLFNGGKETFSSGSGDVLGYPLSEYNDRICNGCQYGKPRSGSRSHAGIDLAAKSGTEVLAPLDGEVTDAAIRDNACGGTIAIEHGKVGGHETKTRYCHIKELKVSKGQKVKKGDVIGISGGASGDIGMGSSSGAHLHFELYKDGNHLDPKEYVLASTEEGRRKLWA